MYYFPYIWPVDLLMNFKSISSWFKLNEHGETFSCFLTEAHFYLFEGHDVPSSLLLFLDSATHLIAHFRTYFLNL